MPQNMLDTTTLILDKIMSQENYSFMEDASFLPLPLPQARNKNTAAVVSDDNNPLRDLPSLSTLQEPEPLSAAPAPLRAPLPPVLSALPVDYLSTADIPVQKTTLDEMAMDEWRSVPPVIRRTFRSLLHLVEEQRQTMEEQRNTMHQLKLDLDKIQINQDALTGKLMFADHKLPGYVLEDGAVQNYLEQTTASIETVFGHVRSLARDVEHQLELLRQRLSALESKQPTSSQDPEWKSEAQRLQEQLKQKVDDNVLEELMRHIVTRQELRKTVEKKLASLESMQTAQKDELVQRVLQKVQPTVLSVLDETKLQRSRAASPSAFSSSITDSLVRRIHEQYIQPLERKLQVIRDDESKAEPEASQSLAQQLTQDFDEKLFMLSSDVDHCKSMVKEAVTSLTTTVGKPWTRCGQWRWTSGQLKLGSMVPWNEQVSNTDNDNIKWQQDSSVIRILEGGVYEISFAFFTRHQPTLHLVVNDHSVLSAIHSPSYVVRHSSGAAMAKENLPDEKPVAVGDQSVTGCSLLDYMMLPPRSTVAVSYFGKYKGASGFLSLRRL